MPQVNQCISETDSFNRNTVFKKDKFKVKYLFMINDYHEKR